MGRLRSRHSWPPLTRLRPSPSGDLDADPFSYFISHELSTNQQVDINIPPPISTSRRTRSMPLLQRRNSSRRRLSAMGQSPVKVLLRWLERMEKQYFHYPRASPPLPAPVPWNSPVEPLIVTIVPKSRAEGSPTDPPTSPQIASSPPLRGRTGTRYGSSNRVNKNVKSRPRRPRAWKEPGTEIWSIEEEGGNEEGGAGLGISNIG